MIVDKLRQIPGVKLAAPQGAFYVLPDMSAFFGQGVSQQRHLSQSLCLNLAVPCVEVPKG